jgi:hypothetical protein
VIFLKRGLILSGTFLIISTLTLGLFFTFAALTVCVLLLLSYFFLWQLWVDHAKRPASFDVTAYPSLFDSPLESLQASRLCIESRSYIHRLKLLNHPLSNRHWRIFQGHSPCWFVISDVHFRFPGLNKILSLPPVAEDIQGLSSSRELTIDDIDLVLRRVEKTALKDRLHL